MKFPQRLQAVWRIHKLSERNHGRTDNPKTYGASSSVQTVAKAEILRMITMTTRLIWTQQSFQRSQLINTTGIRPICVMRQLRRHSQRDPVVSRPVCSALGFHPTVPHFFWLWQKWVYQSVQRHTGLTHPFIFWHSGTAPESLNVKKLKRVGYTSMVLKELNILTPPGFKGLNNEQSGCRMP